MTNDSLAAVHFIIICILMQLTIVAVDFWWDRCEYIKYSISVNFFFPNQVKNRFIHCKASLVELPIRACRPLINRISPKLKNDYMKVNASEIEWKLPKINVTWEISYKSVYVSAQQQEISMRLC